MPHSFTPKVTNFFQIMVYAEMFQNSWSVWSSAVKQKKLDKSRWPIISHGVTSLRILTLPQSSQYCKSSHTYIHTCMHLSTQLFPVLITNFLQKRNQLKKHLLNYWKHQCSFKIQWISEEQSNPFFTRLLVIYYTIIVVIIIIITITLKLHCWF